MVRTRETATIKVVGAKAPRKASFTPAATSSSDDSAGKGKYSGGNPYCPRETPAWQKGITCFFGTSSTSNKAADSKDSDKPSSEGSPTKTAEASVSNESTSAATSSKEDTSNKENEAASSSS